MMSKVFLTSVFLFLEFSFSFGRQAAEISDFPKEINKCLSSDFHKGAPSRNTEPLAGECQPWSNRSCCTKERASEIMDGDVYNLNQNFCQEMSKECKKYFKKDACFFECSPNLGMWMQPFEGELQYQRFNNVPLCKKDCDEWFNACSNDFTCSENWYKNKDKCNKKKCQQISDLFKTAQEFCEKIWDNSYKVIENDEDCMTFSFDKKNNPNDIVAMKYYSQKNSASNIPSNYIFYIPVAMLILQYIY